MAPPVVSTVKSTNSESRTVKLEPVSSAAVWSSVSVAVEPVFSP